MNNIGFVLCGCSIGVGAIGCSCSHEAPSTAPKWSGRTADTESEEPAIPTADEAHAPATTPTVEPIREAVAEREAGEPATASLPTAEAGGAPAHHAQPATPPSGPAMLDMEVITPPPRPGRPSAQDTMRVAAEVEGHLQAAQSLAQQGRFGEACRRLLAAYEALEAETEENGGTHSDLREAVLEKLEAYGEQANRAAGGEAAGRTLSKPLSVN